MTAVLEVLTATSATPTVTFDWDDERALVAVTGNVTVTVTNLAGTALATNAVADVVSAGIYSWPMPAQASPDLLTLTWAGTFAGVARTVRTLVEVVGGHYFSIGTLRSSDSVLGAAAGKPLTDAVWTNPMLIDARRDAELEAMRLTGHSCVTRAGTERMVSRQGILVPRYGQVRAVRSARDAVTGATIDPTPWTIEGSWRTSLYTGLAHGQAVDVVYEHGCTDPPTQVVRACLVRARHMLARLASKLPEQTERFTVTDQGTLYVALPTSTSSGNAHVDAAYRSHTCQVGIA